VTAAVAPVVVVPHPTYASGTACDATGCHTDYKHKTPYLGACELCHNTENWKRVTYKHKDAAFDNGMHPLVGCAKCHTEGDPVPAVERPCSTCHEPPHKGWSSCGSCHSTFAWRLFNPLPKGHLSLDGGHKTLACLDCHTAKTEPATPRQCVACHGTNHGGLRTCQDCHAPATGWEPKPGWSHGDFFTLRGAHKKLECAQCHVKSRFAGTPKVCVGCHGSKHGGLTDCGSCHTTSAFKPPTFDHSDVFKLTGAHTKLKCSRCHPNSAFGTTISHGGTACGDCHPAQHGGLTACGSCHVTKAFVPASKFDHSDYFPLVGQHAALYAEGKCSACHTDGKFAIVPGRNCVDCHGENHGGQTECAKCHTPAGWTQTLPIVHPDASVVLGPSHAWPNACSRCHLNNVFSGPTVPCASCHGVGAPGTGQKIPHVGPSDCMSCHQPTAWADAHFTHPIIPNFDNTAPSGHDYTDFGGYPTGCAECHTNGATPDFTTYSCTAAGCHQ
jgi:hypothetical protein